MAEQSRHDHVDVIVIGAGMSGLYSVYSLREAGFTIRAFESGSSVGGTWYWNRYPGARCDVESFDYSFSFSDELQQSWRWTERYAPQSEILHYLEHVSERFELARHFTFGTRVVSATYDDAQGWVVTTDTGEQATSSYIVFATGALSSPRLPDIEGIEDFEGDWYHTAQWPETDPDFSEKRVGVIGTGSTGIQISTTLAPRTAKLSVFQRSPNYSMPAQNRPITDEAWSRVKANYTQRRLESRRTRRGFPVPADVSTGSAFDENEKQRTSRYEHMWAHGGAIFTSTYGDLGVDAEANETAAEFVRTKIRSIVHDPDVAEALSPRDHPLGGRRPCVDTGYFEIFNRPNVELVDIRTDPIVRVTARGIATETRDIALDALIFATGFDAITGAMSRIDIRGRSGVRLADLWKDGPRAYLGLMAESMPNAFIITGPGSPSVLANMSLGIEHHIELMTSILVFARNRGWATVEAAGSAVRSWAEHVQHIADKTLVGQTSSWYTGANVPGKPRTFMPYAGGLASFIEECDRIASRGFEGFVFSAPARAMA